jgi:hypothetical protein
VAEEDALDRSDPGRDGSCEAACDGTREQGRGRWEAQGIEKQFAERREGIGSDFQQDKRTEIVIVSLAGVTIGVSPSRRSLATPRNATLRNSAKVDAAAYRRKSHLEESYRRTWDYASVRTLQPELRIRMRAF